MKKWTTMLAGLTLASACWAGHPVDVNSASPEAIADGLDGVGLSKAQAIVAYRQANGPFRHADELVNVKGIGLSTVDKNRDYIRLGGESKVAAKGG